jgi:anti-sigma factor RsiW
MDNNIDDAVLSAWLDDELDAVQRERVEAWLREHPEDAARVRLWAADRDALRARLDPVLDESLPSKLTHTLWSHRAPSARRRWLMAAAAAGLFIAGGVVGALWQGERRSTAAASSAWVQRAAIAHSVYVPEQRHPVEVRAQEEHLARWLTRRAQVPVKLYDLSGLGFELVGGRLLPEANSPSAQLMYQNGAGQRVTVYLRKPEKGTLAAFRYERRGELGLFYWVEEDCGYALAGALPRETLFALAQAIDKQHDEKR